MKDMTENAQGLNTSERHLLLYQYLITHTSKGHVAKTRDLIDYLRQNGIQVHINTLYNDLAVLQGSIFGLELEYDFSKKGYWVKNPPFASSDLRLIADSVQSNKFISQKKADALTQKIKTLGDSQIQGHRLAFVANRVRNQDDTNIKGADRIYQAIEEDSQIKFRYFHYSPDRSKEKSYTKGGEWLTVSPFALYWNNGNLYLYAYDSKRFRYYRVDRMENIGKPLGVKREGKEQYNEKSLTASRSKIFDMYSGEEYDVKMRFHNRIAHSVIDQFGKDIMMLPDGKNHFVIRQKVQISPPFFAWIATFGRSAKIVEPPEVVKKMREFLQKSMDMYKDDGNT